ncbi:Xaa-Pro peptidase family protein [Sporosarcina sp. FSL W7-1349]|uniref:M24 family metallopeptidase n=1 Tax=Sporosarcina sp. FSL W7-1349 TaxID=2921561 RepID=UPI0030F4DF93
MKQVDVLRNYVSEANVQAGFITTPDNVFYLSSFQSEPHERLLGIMVFPEEEPFLICPRMEVPDAKAAGWPYEIVGYSDTEDAWTVLWESVRKRGIAPSSVAIEKSHLTVDRFERMQELFPNAEFKSLDGQLNEMRVIKSEEELTNMRKAAELADLAIHIGCEEIAEGKTELEILMKVEYEMMKRGAEKMAFETMVLSGPKTASPHGKPGDRKIQQGDFILFDLGVVYNGYCSDITRTVAFGEPTDEMRTIYETVRKAEQAAVEIVRPGIQAKTVDQTARKIIEDAGYGDYFTHRIGHGLGISIHEYPSVTDTNELVLREGMVFTIEPGIYVPGLAGVRIEDDVAVTADGVEVLTKFPKELLVLRN